MSFGVFRPLYERLRQDQRVEVWLTAFGDVWPPEETFRLAGPDARLAPRSGVPWMSVDVYMNADLWDMSWLRRRTCRMHLFHGVAGKYGLDAPVDLAPAVAAFDCLMFANADRRRRYVEAALVPDDDVKAALVGYPKTDCLVDGSLDRTSIARSLALDPAVPVVIYAPTWSPYSSLNTMGQEVVDQLAAEGLQVIVKLHDRSYDRERRGSGGIDWHRQFLRYESHPLVRVVRTADGCPLLAAADAMVSDHSSIAFEYMLLDRPIVVIDRPELIEQAGISPEKVQRLRAATTMVATPAETAGAVARGLQHPQELSAERRQTASELFYQPGTATNRALALIYRMLDLPAPALADAPARIESRQTLQATG